MSPADAAEGIASEGETEDAEDPCGMNGAECEDLIEGDSAEGVPEEKGTDEKAGDGLVEVTGLGGRGGGVHAETGPGLLWEWRLR